MPYNPGSAYPRKTVYVPPTYGDTSFQRAVNAPDVSSSASAGGIKTYSQGRGAYSEAARGAAAASNAPDAATGFAAMQRKGIVGQLQDRYMEQRGLRQNQSATGSGKPPEVQTPAERAASHGNPAATQKRQAASTLADQMVEGVVTGDMPGDTGRANTKKSRKKSDPNQTTLF